MRREWIRRVGSIVACASCGSVLAGPAPVPFGDLVLLTGPDSPRSLAPADVDGDGDIDLFVASSADHRVSWLENDGRAPPALTRRVITSAATGAQHVVAADINGDGRLDAVSAAFGANRVSWHENIAGAAGAPPAFTTRTITSTAQGAQCVAVADINGDGLLDVAFASFNDNTIAWRQQVAGMDGAPPTWQHRAVSSGVAGATWVAAADLDLDGDTDLVGASFNAGRIVWFENTPGADGAPPTFTERTLASSAPGVIALHVADLDADGDPDALSACFNDNALRLHENLLTAPGMGPPSFATMIVDAGASGPMAVSAADVDEDDDQDILGASLFGAAVTWHERTPGPAPEDPPVFVEREVADELAAPRAVIALDLDADGDRDVVSCTQHDDRVTLHDNLLPRVFNLDTGAGYQTMHAAIGAAASGHTISAVRPGWTAREFLVDFVGKAVRVESVGAFEQPAGAMYTLADGASIHAATDEPLTLGGRNVIGVDQHVRLEGWPVSIGPEGDVDGAAGAIIEILSSEVVVVAGELRCAGTLLIDAGVRTEAGAVLAASGFVGGAQTHAGEWRIEHDALAFDAVSIEPTGSLHIVGARLALRTDLPLGGELRIDGGAESLEPDDVGFTIAGDLVAGAGAALVATGGASIIEITGDVDLAIDDVAQSDLGGATLRFVGPGARSLEAASADIGPAPGGLDPGEPGRFPIGALHVLAGATLTLVDTHDNSAVGDGAEALYVRDIVVEDGATLNVGALRVFCESLSNMGSIDQPANIRFFGTCPGDLTEDGSIGFADLNVIVSNFNAQGPPGTLVGDIDGDGLVGFSDLNVVVSAFNTDC